MHQWKRSTLIGVMTCCLVDATSLPDTMVLYCQFDRNALTSVLFESQYIDFHSRSFENVAKISAIMFRRQCVAVCNVDESKSGSHRWKIGMLSNVSPRCTCTCLVISLYLLLFGQFVSISQISVVDIFKMVLRRLLKFIILIFEAKDWHVSHRVAFWTLSYTRSISNN